MASFTLGPHWLHNRGLKKPEGSTHAGQGKAGTQLSDSQKTVMHFFFFFWVTERKYTLQAGMSQSKSSQEGFAYWKEYR